METDILTQALEIAAALALGVCLGFIYDLFRAARQLFPGLVILTDLVFCIIAGAGLFMLGMACNGTLRYYMPLASFLGAGVYSAIFGFWLRPLLNKLEKLLEKALEKLGNTRKKLNKNLKNIFSSAKKRFRITKYSKDDKLGKGVSKSGARKAWRKGEYDEISQNQHTYKAYYPGDTALCSFHDDLFGREEGGGRGSPAGTQAAGGYPSAGE